MRVLLDQGTPVPIRQFHKNHTVLTAVEQSWDRLSNGELLVAAEAAGFDVLLTTDKNLVHQQNLRERKIAIVVIGNAQWPVLRKHTDAVAKAVDAAIPGSYSVVDVPNS